MKKKSETGEKFIKSLFTSAKLKTKPTDIEKKTNQWVNLNMLRSVTRGPVIRSDVYYWWILAARNCATLSSLQ